MSETYDVYFGKTGSMVLVSSDQSDLSFDLSDYLPLDYNQEYSWRIDVTNEYGTTTGDVWTFITYALKYPHPSIAGGGGGGDDSSETNIMQTIRKLVAFANNKVWIES